MSIVKVIGLIDLIDKTAFQQYRAHVSQTVELYKGKIVARGSLAEIFWNELNCEPFNNFVEIHFPSKEDAHAWAKSKEYQNLVGVRNQAMKLTLFTISV